MGGPLLCEDAGVSAPRRRRGNGKTRRRQETEKMGRKEIEPEIALWIREVAVAMLPSVDYDLKRAFKAAAMEVRSLAVTLRDEGIPLEDPPRVIRTDANGDLVIDIED
jgi:predicted HTH domain antitoxin